MSAYTPGPWRATKDVDARGNPSWRIDSPTMSLICSMSYTTAAQRDADMGTAAMIAEAPAMVEALRGCLESLDVAISRSEGDTFGVHHNTAQDNMDAARAILARIESA